MIDAFIDTVSLQIDTLESFTGAQKDKPRMRTHFAVGYFNARVSSENVQRTEKIRKAFNSPFRPLCYPLHQSARGTGFPLLLPQGDALEPAVKPIDLEQREGRINRINALRYGRMSRINMAMNPHGTLCIEKAAQKEKGELPDLVRTGV
jgi:hypothetical protein